MSTSAFLIDDDGTGSLEKEAVNFVPDVRVQIEKADSIGSLVVDRKPRNTCT